MAPTLDNIGFSGPIEAPESFVVSYFRATPIDMKSPCMCRAVYLVSRENGHWVYRLQPGTFQILNSLAEIRNAEDLKEPAPEKRAPHECFEWSKHYSSRHESPPSELESK